MTSIFDGMAGLLNDVFGGPVVHAPSNGVPVTIHAVFRLKPIEELDSNGNAILLMDPTLSVPEPVASTISVGDEVTPESGVTYRILNRHQTGSPAQDARVIFELRKVSENV